MTLSAVFRDNNKMLRVSYLVFFFLLIQPFQLGLIATASSEQVPLAAAAQEDIFEDEANVNIEETKHSKDSAALQAEENTGSDTSSLANTALLFTRPALGYKTSGDGLELPVGENVHVLISFSHKGKPSDSESDHLRLDTIDASIRYPQDYSYIIQNFTTLKMDRVVEAGREASLSYTFSPSAQLAGRAFGLTMRLHYQDSEGRSYLHPIFNDTVLLVEPPETGLNWDMIFLGLLLASIVALVSMGVYHVVTLRFVGKSRARAAVERGTGLKDDLDYDWIPKEHLDIMNRKSSPQTSPRQRKTKRVAGKD